MILAMDRVRVLGPRPRLGEVLAAVQDLGILHVAPAPHGDLLAPPPSDPGLVRERRALRRLLDDVDAVLAALGAADTVAPLGPVPARRSFAGWARLAGRLRRRLAVLADAAAAAEEERALILKYRGFYDAFADLLRSEASWPNASAYHVVLRGADRDAEARLREGLRAVVGDGFELATQRLASGDTALLIIVTRDAASRVERQLAEARVEEVPLPASFGGHTLAEALPWMRRRLELIPGELGAIDRQRRTMRDAHAPDLARARRAAHDRLAALDALPRAAVTAHAFVLEGWLPAEAVDAFAARLRTAAGEEIVVERCAREEWAAAEAPVVLRNPRLFRPFETISRIMPLPRYGTIDPTPFVAVFFPVLFGLMLGDVGYGLVIIALAAVLHRRSAPGSRLRSVAEMAGPCAALAIVAGLLFGEFFGDLGHRWFGMRPLAFDRGEALLPFLGLSLAIGLVHVLVGLVLGVVTAARTSRRHALGKGTAALMVTLIVVALLAVGEVLPPGLLTPAVIALLVAFPVLVAAEGLVAPLELLSTLGSVLSYARVMALGTASVMLAVVANRMVGAMGSALVGVLFALLFHLVNFVIGVFSPTIHSLRLQYVEFFGKFYSPGGQRYDPLRHWVPGGPAAPLEAS